MDSYTWTWVSTKTYLQQLCADTGWSLRDLLGAMDDRIERERERKRESEKSVQPVRLDNDYIYIYI